MLEQILMMDQFKKFSPDRLPETIITCLGVLLEKINTCLGVLLEKINTCLGVLLQKINLCLGVLLENQTNTKRPVTFVNL